MRRIHFLALVFLVGCAEGEELGPIVLGAHAAGTAGIASTSPPSGSSGGHGGAGSLISEGTVDAASLGGAGAGGVRANVEATDGSHGDAQAEAAAQDAGRDATLRVEAGPAPKGITLLYKCTDTNPSDSQVAPSYRIVNTGGSTLSLSDFKVRYFLSAEGKAKLLHDFMYAEVNGGPGYRDIRNEAKVSITAALPSRPGADTVVEVAFTAAAGTLADAQTSTINFVVHTEGYALNLNEADDYSHDLTRTDFGTNDKVTLYYKDQLVAGTEP